MGDESSGQDERRKEHRLNLRLPIQGRVGKGEYLDLEVIDISLGGMQISNRDFEVIKSGFDPEHNRAEFEIRIVARLAWGQTGPNETYLTGWEFGNGEPRVG